ncbi:MAG: cation-transporting P-type ATPase [Thermodesulfobacteriota bacterium]
MEELLCRHCHQIPAEEAAMLLESDLGKGLSRFEVKHRQEYFGPNVVSGRKGRGWVTRFLLQFHQPLVYILLVAAAVTGLLEEWVDALVILGVVLVNAFVGFVQESKAERALESLKEMVSTEATVIRDGTRQRVPSAELVPGDLILLQSGDRVPADMRLHLVRELQVDESALTGESVPVEKTSVVLAPDTVLADRRNMAYAGTMVTSGQAQGIAIATGDHTEAGRISKLISETEGLATPLTRKISAFSKLLLMLILGLAGVTFLVGWMRGEPALEMFKAAVALAVGAIPEGLPAAMTITLAIGVKRMARRRAIIRRLPAVETLGSTTVICSDKTGTLTENQMTVQEIWAGGLRYSVTGSGYDPEGQILHNGEQVSAASAPPLSECLTAGLLCNESQLQETNGRWTVQGDPTEGALITAARKGGLVDADVKERLPRLDIIPFESERQYMATLHRHPTGKETVIYVKGAVERVLERCSQQMDGDGSGQPLDKNSAVTAAEEMARRGLRVLAFAMKGCQDCHVKFGHQDVASGLTFVGLQGMIDPPREEIIPAIRECKAAGVRVKMITGDHALTASAIAREIGLEDSGEGPGPLAVTGAELSTLTDHELIEVADRASVFARVAPEQKLRLVEALQEKDQIVAMTGDGVNDAPALKRADIGIAMGITGTDVAKETADMVLTDDNFATIVAAVEEGRRLFDNLIKFLTWTLPTNGGEGLVILAAVFAGVALPILPVQILWINMTTAVLLGLMLAFEPMEPDVMMRPPRDPKGSILSGQLLWRVTLVSAILLAGAFGLFVLEKRLGATVAEARTVAVNVFVLVELLYLFNCRSLNRSMWRIGLFSNPWVIWGSVTMLMVQLLFTYAPFMNVVFHSTPIRIDSWIRIVLVSVAGYVIVEIEKGIRRALSGRKAQGSRKV